MNKRKFLTIQLYREGKFFFAENEKLAICGTGSTIEAMKELVK